MWNCVRAVRVLLCSNIECRCERAYLGKSMNAQTVVTPSSMGFINKMLASVNRNRIWYCHSLIINIKLKMLFGESNVWQFIQQQLDEWFAFKNKTTIGNALCQSLPITSTGIFQSPNNTRKPMFLPGPAINFYVKNVTNIISLEIQHTHTHTVGLTKASEKSASYFKSSVKCVVVIV